ncbi:MAG: metallophosphoesterase family protein [Candidatus Omnitrophota bacterium]
MRIGVISDTHIPEQAQEIPRQILEAFKSVDMIVHAGDLVDLGVLRLLEACCSNVKAVWGNMDPQPVRDVLLEREIFMAAGFKVGLTHGCGRPAKLLELIKEDFKKDKPDLVIFGHSHTAVNITQDRTIYFNPGSPTDKVFAAYNSYGIIEIRDKIEPQIFKI